MWFSKKPKVEFGYMIPNMDNIMPIIKTSEYQHAWVARARQQVVDLKRKNPDLFKEQFIHVAKCPAIKSVMQRGWIVRSWMDIMIETSNNGEDIKWTSAINQEEILPKRDVVGFHLPEQLSDFYENWPDDASRLLIKVNTPFTVKLPRGYSMMLMPVAYADEKRFTAMTGLIESDLPISAINVQMRWHVKEGKELIRAGTPLAQLILIKDEDIEVTQTYKNYKDFKFTNHLVYGNRFSRMYSDIKRTVKNGENKDVN
jgi:hypothetical protein